MTHDELYNALLDRLNTLIPARLELREGCEFFWQANHKDYTGHYKIVDVCPKKEIEEYIAVYQERYRGEDTAKFDGRLKTEDCFVILGTPPTLQEILLVLKDCWASKPLKISVDGSYIKVCSSAYTHLFSYDLTKLLKDQETSALQAIYDLLV